jgi:putative ABC transport system substrate-binding protein
VKRRELITLLGGAVAVSSVSWPGVTRAQQLGKVPRIGVLVSALPPHPFTDAFRRDLRTFGYSEGQNIAVDFRYTDGRKDRAEELAAELVRIGVDVIVAHFVQAVLAAMGATKTIPIVMAPHGAPLQGGIIDSLARPGGNVTGLSAMDAEIGGKRLQLLRDLIPNLDRTAVLATAASTNPYGGFFVEDLRVAASGAGLRLEPVLVNGPEEFEGAFAAMAKADAQAVIVQPFFDPHVKILVELAAKHRLPYMAASREATAAGALVAVSANFPALYERAAFYVDKIIKGAKPANLPVEQPTKFQVVINMKAAHALGLTISPSLLTQIDEVIE